MIMFHHYTPTYTFQLKNMINALFSSQAHGTKDFECNDVQFGWKDIKVCTYAQSCMLLALRVVENL